MSALAIVALALYSFFVFVFGFWAAALLANRKLHEALDAVDYWHDAWSKAIGVKDWTSLENQHGGNYGRTKKS